MFSTVRTEADGQIVAEGNAFTWGLSEDLHPAIASYLSAFTTGQPCGGMQKCIQQHRAHPAGCTLPEYRMSEGGDRRQHASSFIRPTKRADVLRPGVFQSSEKQIPVSNEAGSWRWHDGLAA